MIFRFLSIGLLLALLAGCATKPKVVEPTTAENPPVEHSPVDVSRSSSHQYICVTKVYLSEFSRAQLLAGGEGKSQVVPVGEILAKKIADRFWVDSAVVASGRPQPTATTGFAQGTGWRQPKSGNRADVQVVLQIQLLKPTGQSYYDNVIGRAEAATPVDASTEAVEKALLQLADLLEGAGICRRVD